MHQTEFGEFGQVGEKSKDTALHYKALTASS